MAFSSKHRKEPKSVQFKSFCTFGSSWGWWRYNHHQPKERTRYIYWAKRSTYNRFTLSLTMKNTDLILEPISGRGFWISNLWFWFISQKILKKEIVHFYVSFTLSLIWRPLKHVELPSLGNWQHTSWDRGTSWWRSHWRAQDAPGSPSGTPGAPSAALWWTPCLSENTVDNDFDAWRSFILLTMCWYSPRFPTIFFFGRLGVTPESWSADWRRAKSVYLRETWVVSLRKQIRFVFCERRDLPGSTIFPYCPIRPPPCYRVLLNEERSSRTNKPFPSTPKFNPYYCVSVNNLCGNDGTEERRLVVQTLCNCHDFWRSIVLTFKHLLKEKFFIFNNSNTDQSSPSKKPPGNWVGEEPGSTLSTTKLLDTVLKEVHMCL